MIASERFPAPDLPFPIFQISQKVKRYLLYDINLVTWLRRTHNILGVFIGGLPQSPQQNIFLGLPLELQVEEVRLLVENGLAFIVNDLETHNGAFQSPPSQLAEYKANVHKEGLATARAVEKQKLQRTQEALQRFGVRQSTPEMSKLTDLDPRRHPEGDEDESLFNAPQPRNSRQGSTDPVPYSSTPTTSYPPISPQYPQSAIQLPEINGPSYALFKHLHSLGYFLSPGLRFGCQFSVYPGDPLRFHSHFLATSAEWDEEIDLLDIVGGGRLGTGVKKGWLIGGVEGKHDSGENGKSSLQDSGDRAREGTTGTNVRTFCIEWGGM
ncbi:MAG: hypothetical protein LQ343_003296 [Gyalolechia ehrenbergii]|nr:MAG: hypothetical protein LQ343_003296 [Gyalolechia ehrenbergii]